MVIFLSFGAFIRLLRGPFASRRDRGPLDGALRRPYAGHGMVRGAQYGALVRQPAPRATLAGAQRRHSRRARSSRCRWPGMTCARQNGADAHPARVGIAAGVGDVQVGRAAAASSARPSGHSPRRPHGPRPTQPALGMGFPPGSAPTHGATPPFPLTTPMLRLALSVERGAVPGVRPMRACP